MWTAFITGLAALLGAAVGGLVTVWATHLTNTGAAQREREGRQYALLEREYSEATQLLSKFLGEWRYIGANIQQHGNSGKADLRGLSIIGAQIDLTFSDFTEILQRMQYMTTLYDPAKMDRAEEEFSSLARSKLESIRPE